MIVLATLLSATVLMSCKKDKPETKPDANATIYLEANGVVTIKDLGKGTGTKTLTADKEWVLDGLVFVNSG